MIPLADSEGLDQTARSDLGLHCPLMPGRHMSAFSRGAVHVSKSEYRKTSRKHAYIILTPLNPTFI